MRAGEVAGKKRTISYGSRAVVTGAGSGIGRAFAIELGRRGGRVVCSDLDVAAAEKTARAVAQAGGLGFAVRCDVASEADVRGLAEHAAAWLVDPVDLIVNNAGIGVGGHVVGESSLDDWRRTVDVNLWGVIHGCHVFAPMLRAQGRGGIINVASAAGFAAAPRMSAYNVTKAGVLALSETLAAELFGSGVSVSVLCPTFVKTNIVHRGLLTDGSARFAASLMKWSGVSAGSVARTTLDAHDAGQLYVLPQLDARAIWRVKRAAPTAYARGLGLISRTVEAFTRGGA